MDAPLHKQCNRDVQRMKLWLYFHRASQQFCRSPDRRPVPLVDYSGVPVVASVGAVTVAD